MTGPHKASQPTLTRLSQQLNAPLPPGLDLAYLAAYAIITSLQQPSALALQAVIYLSSSARINVTNATGGFLYHSNRDIWSIYGAWSPYFMLASGIEVTPAYLENSANQWPPQRQRQEERRQTKVCMAMRLQHNRLSSNSISPNNKRSSFYSAWIDRWIEWYCLFLYEVSIRPLALPTQRQQTAVSALVRQRVGVAVSSMRPDVRQECAHHWVGSMFLPATCNQPRPSSILLFVSFAAQR